MRTRTCWGKYDDGARPLRGVDHCGNLDRARCRLGDRMAGRLAQTMIWCGDGTKAHAARGVGRIAPPTSVRSRVVPPSGKPVSTLHCTALLTPYTAVPPGRTALPAWR